jgi:hypothetical protein
MATTRSPATLLATPSSTAAEAPSEGYFSADAFRVEPGDDLQRALDTHQRVRLSRGMFPAVTVRSGQRLAGVPGMTEVASVTIEPGSHDFEVKGVSAVVTFPPSDKLTRDGIVSLQGNNLVGDGATLHNMIFWANYLGTQSFDRSVMTDCRIVHPASHGYDGTAPALRLHSRNGRSSNGCAIVGFNALGSRNTALSVSGHGGFVVVGYDEETPELHKDGGPSIRVRNSGRFSALAVGGNTHGNDSIDTGAEENLFVYCNLANDGKRDIVLQPTVKAVRSFYSPRIPSSGPDMPIGRPFLAWARPTARAVPAAAVAPRNDDTDDLQWKLNLGQVVELEPRIYRTTRPLRITTPGTVIIGVAGKTTIVADHADAVLKTAFGKQGTFGLSLIDLSLQGGRIGLLCNEAGVQLNRCAFSHVTFRDHTEAGFFADHCYGVDNNEFEFLNFINCGAGLKSRGESVPGQESAHMAYFDKLHSYRCQFIECGRALDFEINRAFNLDTFTDCVFSRNKAGAHITYGANSMCFVNCVFDRDGGATMLDADSEVVVSCCSFIGARDTRRFLPDKAYVEGCAFQAGEGPASLAATRVQNFRVVAG